jgi:hypothetical protein
MIDPKKLNLDQLPKKFCDGAVGGHTKEFFSFALTSGNNLDSFATTPKVMKSIAVWIQGQVRSYEKQFGEIDMTPSGTISPIQAADLGKA